MKLKVHNYDYLHHLRLVIMLKKRQNLFPVEVEMKFAMPTSAPTRGADVGL
ncbi:MAG TPA: hypothetical protein VF043_15540 [Ktedonobacteraceae bacterium]